jgi:hypothetical protein
MDNVHTMVLGWLIIGWSCMKPDPTLQYWRMIRPADGGRDIESTPWYAAIPCRTDRPLLGNQQRVRFGSRKGDHLQQNHLDEWV